MLRTGKALCLALAALSVLALCSCQSAPLTGRSQFIVTSVEGENEDGEDAWQDVLKKEKPCADPKFQEAVERVGRNIAMVVERPDFKWEFRAFESKEANAFCLPGGKVAVYSGLRQYVSNEAELACVMGHEIGHAAARHGGERMAQAYVKEIGSTVLSLALNDYGITSAAFSAASGAGMLHYSRSQEYEADYLGMIYMAKAGYDPKAALSFWRKFGSGDGAGSSGLGQYLSSHPMGEKRLGELGARLPEAEAAYQAAPLKSGLGLPLK